MEPLVIAQQIEKKIEDLGKGRQLLIQRAEEKAKRVAEYDRELAKTILMLRSGDEIVWEGETIKEPPVTLIERIAKGYVWREKLEQDKAESFYRNAVIGMNALMAETNALQSIFRHLEEV